MRMDQAYAPPSSASPMRMRRVANALLRLLSRPPRGTIDGGGVVSTAAAATSSLHVGTRERCTFLDRLAQAEARDASGSCDVVLVPRQMRCGDTTDIAGARELRADAAPTEAAIAAEAAIAGEAAIAAGPAAGTTVTATALALRRKAATRRLVEPLVSGLATRMADARMAMSPPFGYLARCPGSPDEACDATACLLTYDTTRYVEEKEIDLEVSTQNIHLPSCTDCLERLAEAEARDARLLAETSVTGRPPPHCN